jgi:hypothetical protein
VIRIVQYICASADCGATWRVLPRFLARHLWRIWETVERTVKPKDTAARADAPKVPERTARRWRARLAMAAALLIALLAGRGTRELHEFAANIDAHATRGELVDAFAERFGVSPGQRLGSPAAIVHQLERGIRLM